MINKKEIDFVTLSLSHHIMQTMDPRKESVEDESEENGKRARAFFFFFWPTNCESRTGGIWLWTVFRGFLDRVYGEWGRNLRQAIILRRRWWAKGTPSRRFQRSRRKAVYTKVSLLVPCWMEYGSKLTSWNERGTIRKFSIWTAGHRI